MSPDDKAQSLPWGRTRGTAPHQTNTKHDSKWVFSLYTLHTAFYQCYNSGTMCPIGRTNLWLGQWPSITYINKECSISQYNVTMCSIKKRTTLWLGQWPSVTCKCHINQYSESYWKETISHFCDTLEMWILSNSVGIKRTRNQLSVQWNFLYPNP